MKKKSISTELKMLIYINKNSYRSFFGSETQEKSEVLSIFWLWSGMEEKRVGGYYERACIRHFIDKFVW